MMSTGGGSDESSTPAHNQGEPAALIHAAATPAMLRSMAGLQAALAGLNRQIATSLEPALEGLRRQQRQMAAAFAATLGIQAHLQEVAAPALEVLARPQRELATALQVPVVATAELQSRLARLVITSELAEALRRVNELAPVEMPMPTAEGIDRLSTLIDQGEFDDTALQEAEVGVQSDQGLAAAVEDAAELLAKQRPLISRRRARQIIVLWVWLMWSAALLTVAVAAPPAVAAVPGAIGLPAGAAAARKVGEEFDKRFLPEEPLEQ